MTLLRDDDIFPYLSFPCSEANYNDFFASSSDANGVIERIRRPANSCNLWSSHSEELCRTGVDEAAEPAFQFAVELLIADERVSVTQDPADAFALGIGQRQSDDQG